MFGFNMPGTCKVPDGLMAILIRYTKYNKDLHLREKTKNCLGKREIQSIIQNLEGKYKKKGEKLARGRAINEGMIFTPPPCVSSFSLFF